jgi:hypothetical protein
VADGEVVRPLDVDEAWLEVLRELVRLDELECFEEVDEACVLDSLDEWVELDFTLLVFELEECPGGV